MKKMIALLLAITMAILLCACGSTDSTTTSSKDVSTESINIVGKIDANGTAYIPMMDGTVISLQGDVEIAALIDGTTIVVLETDGLLYITSPSNIEEKTTIAKDAETISVTRSTGIIYKDMDGQAFRYTFADASSVLLGTDIAISVAGDSLSMLIADDQGYIYILAQDSTETDKIGSYQKSIELKGISDNGTIAAWVEKDSDAETHTMHLYADEEHYKLEEVNYKYNYTSLQFNEASTFAAVTNLYSENVYFIPIGGTDVVCAKLGSELSWSQLYTAEGPLYEDSSSEITEFYVLSEADNGSNLYCISMDGDREKMATNIEYMATESGRIYYQNNEHDLYTAKLDGSMLVDETKIASDVYTFEVSANGKYIYYMKNLDENVGSLYRCSTTDFDKSEKISSNVYNYYSSYYYPVPYFFLSIDGESVYYFEDVEEGIGGTSSKCGTLKCAAVGSEPVRVATDVIVARPSSGLRNNQLNPNSFVFEKYITVEDDNLLVNLVYYNGTETTTLAKEVYH